MSHVNVSSHCSALSIAFWLESIVLILGGGKINYIFWFFKDKNHMKKTHVSPPKIKKKIKRNTKKKQWKHTTNLAQTSHGCSLFSQFFEVIQQISFKIMITRIMITINILVMVVSNQYQIDFRDHLNQYLKTSNQYIQSISNQYL